MNFSMRSFIKSGFLNAVGKMGDYWIILNAAGWSEKGVLLEADLVEIQTAINRHNATSPDDNGEPVPEVSAPDENGEPAPEVSAPDDDGKSA